MKQFRAKYMFKNADKYSRYITEIIDAKGVMHAHKLATTHAKEMNAAIDGLEEIAEEEKTKCLN